MTFSKSTIMVVFAVFLLAIVACIDVQTPTQDNTQPEPDPTNISHGPALTSENSEHHSHTSRKLIIFVIVVVLVLILIGGATVYQGCFILL
ncbi:hypothetical protein Lalb_Chr21g0317181 [Lupinus albus]|uniref:Transmembrane protein n=1 Tax=Lupinus albus TaxID=3870 RepID=A0A6A4N8E0_LUPAL|nr:hypothetical protein Lalb_Chr21g0317181 [Lupinus albus]